MQVLSSISCVQRTGNTSVLHSDLGMLQKIFHNRVYLELQNYSMIKYKSVISTGPVRSTQLVKLVKLWGL